ncbi:MAG: hypothetical protein ACI9V9_001091, partial [Oleispira sp.]
RNKSDKGVHVPAIFSHGFRSNSGKQKVKNQAFYTLEQV